MTKKNIVLTTLWGIILSIALTVAFSATYQAGVDSVHQVPVFENGRPVLPVSAGAINSKTAEVAIHDGYAEIDENTSVNVYYQTPTHYFISWEDETESGASGYILMEFVTLQ